MVNDRSNSAMASLTWLALDAVAINPTKIRSVFRRASQLRQHFWPAGSHFNVGQNRSVHLGFERRGAAIPELPEIEAAVQHRGSVNDAHGSMDANRPRPSVGAALLKNMAGRAGYLVVVRQPRIVKQLAAQRNFSRI